MSYKHPGPKYKKAPRTVVIRNETDQIWGAVRKKLLQQPNKDFPLKGQVRKACQRLAVAKEKLCKPQVRNLVSELKLAEPDADLVFIKVCEVGNIYAQLENLIIRDIYFQHQFSIE